MHYTLGIFGGYDVDGKYVEEYVNQYKLWLQSGGKDSTPENNNFREQSVAKNQHIENTLNGALYSIDGVRGRHIDIFDDKCIITTKVTIGSILTHNATDGSKTIYYADVVGVQFKEPGITIGYLQLETPGLTMNNAASNFFNENSFTFDTTVIATDKMKEIAAFIESKVQEIKHSKAQQQAQAVNTTPFSVADELLKFKQLLDMGAITQEEFDTKKSELLKL
ncbi:MAG: SHOCT domain-containing protein [Eubacterium sp.]|nr:SHOCT domain-containing protein [Eubacterium sp.]